MLRPPFRQISASSTKILFHHEVCFHVVRFMSSQKPGITVEAHLSALRLEGKKRSRREHLRLRFYPFSRHRPHAAPYCRLNQQRRFTFEASGGWTKPASARGYRPVSRRLLRAELSHQRIHLRLTGLVQCAAQRYLRFTQSEFLHLFQLGAHQPRGSRGP